MKRGPLRSRWRKRRVGCVSHLAQRQSWAFPHPLSNRRLEFAASTSVSSNRGHPSEDDDSAMHAVRDVAGSRLNKIAANDLKRLGDVSQFWDDTFAAARNPLILKWRDVRVVEGARLESEACEHHAATSKRLNAHAISGLTFQNDHSVCVRKPRCSSGF
jgi:hypothetical protein